MCAPPTLLFSLLLRLALHSTSRFVLPPRAKPVRYAGKREDAACRRNAWHEQGSGSKLPTGMRAADMDNGQRRRIAGQGLQAQQRLTRCDPRGEAALARDAGQRSGRRRAVGESPL